MNLVKKLRRVFGWDEDDTIHIVTPQFEREDGVEPGQPPTTAAEMDALKRADEQYLLDIGLRCWSEESGLWLLPHEWHPHIPDDYPLRSILDEDVTRADLPATPDKRFGCLAVGIIPEFEEET